MAAAIVSHTAFNTKRIADGLDEGFLDATALAEYLVRKGIPFRQAHGIVGGLVALCEKEGKKKLGQLTIDQFKAACDKIEENVFCTLNPKGVCQSYKTAGSAGPESAKAQIVYWKGKLKEQ
jgi:argininosuccinate lyase